MMYDLRGPFTGVRPRFLLVILLLTMPLLTQAQRLKRPMPRNQYRVFVGGGLALNAVIDTKHREWVERDSGLGFLQGFGAVALAEMPLSNRISLTLELGGNGFQVKRIYERNQGNSTDTKRLLQFPLLVGAKLYGPLDFYLHPQAGLSSFRFTQWQEGATKTRQDAQRFTVAVRAGREFPLARGGWLDVSLGVQYCPDPLFTGQQDAMRYANLRAIWKTGWLKGIKCPPLSR